MNLARRGLSKLRTVLNPAVAMAVQGGFAPRMAHILTTTGRKSGRARSTPVILVERAGIRYLVAPYGEVAWVHNVRADSRVRLTRGRTTEELEATEVEPAEAGPVLREYVSRWWPLVAPYFNAGPSDPEEAFAAEVPRHPVFRLGPPSPEMGNKPPPITPR